MPTENILLVSKMEIQWVLTSMHTTLTKELSGSSTSSTSYKNCIRMKFEFRRKTYPTLPQKRLHNLLFISISYKQKQINLFELDLIGDFTWILLLLVFFSTLYLSIPFSYNVFVRTMLLFYRNRLESNSEHWNALLLSLRELTEWVIRKDTELTQLRSGPLRGDAASLQKQLVSFPISKVFALL